MRVVIIFVLLVILGFIAWKAAERFKIIEPPKVEEATPAPEGAGAGEETPAPSLPSFDIVYVTREGDATIAGRATPGSKVKIYANGEPLAEATTGPDGSWAISTETPLSSGAVELTLDMTTPDGVTIKPEQTILIYAPEREGARPRVVRTTPGGATGILQEPR